MISVARQGCDLAITIEGRDDLQPYVIPALPGRMGKQLTLEYIRTLNRDLPATRMEEILMISIDGGRWEGEGDEERLVPLPPEQRTNYARLERELSTRAAQDILHPAFFWQTVLEIDAVNIYIGAGGGYVGGLKALGSLVQTLGLSPLVTSPSTESVTQTLQQANMSPTSSPQGGPTLAKLPTNKQSRKPKKGR